MIKTQKTHWGNARRNAKCAQNVTHQKTRFNRGSKCREECTELTDQRRQLRSLATPNKKCRGCRNFNSRRNARWNALDSHFPTGPGYDRFKYLRCFKLWSSHVAFLKWTLSVGCHQVYNGGGHVKKCIGTGTRSRLRVRAWHRLSIASFILVPMSSRDSASQIACADSLVIKFAVVRQETVCSQASSCRTFW